MRITIVSVYENMEETVVKYGMINSLQSPRFSGVKTFMRMQNVRTLKDVDFVVAGIPFDTCTTYRDGARFGPAAVREMSGLAAKPCEPELGIDIFEKLSGVDYGDIGTVPGYIEESFDVIQREMREIFAAGVVPVVIGGDHSVTLPELRACHDVLGPVSLVHFDAHFDSIPEYFGKPYSHGTPFYHAAKEGLVIPEHSIQIGIREGMYSMADADNSRDLGYNCIRACEMHHMTQQEVIDRVCACVGDRKVFLTFDIDFLDPSAAPGTGTPVPGGFQTWETLEILRGLRGLNIVGYDLVEVSPTFDPSGITSITGASIIQEFLSMLAWRRKEGRIKK